MRVEFPSYIPTYQISSFEQQVNKKIKKLEPGQKINIAITTVDSHDIQKIEKKLKRLGYTVYISSGYMTVKK
jgi:diphthamide synthase subunit DPH2